MKINLKVKCKVYPLEVEEETTIHDLKKKLESEIQKDTPIKAEDMKFIASGRILGNSETLKSCNLTDNMSIFVTGPSAIKKEAPAAKEKPAYKAPEQMPTGRAPGPGINAATADMMGAQIDKIMEDDSMFDLYFGGMIQGKSDAEKEKWKELVKEQMRVIKDNPEMMQNMMEQFSGMDPQALQGMMQNGGQGVPGMGGMPGMGMPAYQPPMQQPFGQQPLAQPQQPGYPNMYPPQMYASYPQLSPTIPCCHGFYPPNYPVSPVDYNEKYKSQLETLESMQFNNKELNLKALIKANGDITIAIDYLIEWNKNNKDL